MRQFCMCSVPVHKRNVDKSKIDWTYEEVGKHLIEHPEHQLCNLANKEYMGSPEEIRAQLQAEGIPFRQAAMFSNCALFCCCACTDYRCKCRCPQDVFHRINLLCASLMAARRGDSVYFKELYDKSPLHVRYLYDELTSEHPRYFVLYETLNDYLKSRNYRRTEDRPDKLVYSPMFETEIVTKSHSKDGEQIVRKVVDPQTGYAKILNWPRSGVCPFCLPSGTLMRSRIAGKGDRRSKKWKEKFYENEY